MVLAPGVRWIWGALRTSDEWRPCSQGYRLALFCGREIQVDTVEGPGECGE